MQSQDPVEWHSRLLRAWQLALLRFAVTLDNADRLNVMAVAAEIDRGGRRYEEQSNFSFFRKISADLCNAILQQNDAADATLRQYLERIEDPRLKRAFASAVEIDTASPRVRTPKVDNGLWRGLASRNHAPLPGTRSHAAKY
ncbi:hypothetical protein OZ411_17210 [Bradyrhizobium sp. Arg237L]|uniref:hypothetical protein n=1 Tax=Bradyrhizobium sp. Arg237L TaxID=3003352 RepID=UPI00249E29F9|nr:hypothetical protein [Bradyrhizobium sp. Arg237L]MDI4234542.1 hypothetical protein [Bradyrhizobium sp. Arg237L]